MLAQSEKYLASLHRPGTSLGGFSHVDDFIPAPGAGRGESGEPVQEASDCRAATGYRTRTMRYDFPSIKNSWSWRSLSWDRLRRLTLG